MTIAEAGTKPFVAVPASHVDLLTRPILGVFTTIDAEGQPRSTLVKVDLDGQSALAGVPLVANRKASLLVVDPQNTARFLQIRGDAEPALDGTSCRIRARRITVDAIHS